jgi:hypothetical protein
MTLPPKSQHRTNNTGCFIVKWVITYCSPCVVVKYFYTTLRRRCTIHKTDSQSLHWNDQINIYIIEKGEHLSRPSDLAVLIYQGLLTWEFWFIRAFWLGSSDLSGTSDMGVLIYQGLLTWEFWYIRAFWLGSSDLSGPSDMGVLIYQGLLIFSWRSLDSKLYIHLWVQNSETLLNTYMCMKIF